MGFGEILVGGFELCTPDYDSIRESTRYYSAFWFVKKQQLLTATSGAASSLIPGWHLVTMPADAALLVRNMTVTSYGVGAILGRKAGCDDILEDEDIGCILGRWSGEASLSDAVVAKTGGALAAKIGGKAAAKALASAVASSTNLLVGKKLGVKVSAKVVTKFAAKFGTKAAAGMIPAAGAAVSAGLNGYFVHSISQAANDWYSCKIRTAGIR